jgi:hypothetical protein
MASVSDRILIGPSDHWMQTLRFATQTPDPDVA